MNPDFRDLLLCLKEAGARYLVIGAHAVMEYTEPRYTKDFDVCVGTDPANARRVYEALAKFGAPIAELSPEDFCEPGTFFQIGVPPVRIDVITTVAGIEFEDAWSRRTVRNLDDLDVSFISLEDLIRAKEASGRRQDREDLRALLRKPRGPRSRKGNEG